MNVLIKGLEIPEEGAIRVVIQKHRGITVAYTGGDPYRRAHEVVELPEKHGRLIDADAYVSMMEEKCDYEKALDPYVLSVCRGGIKLMPTIMEAEGEEDKNETD